MEAIILLTDRIMRCSHERNLYDVTFEYGYRSSIDFPYYQKVPYHIIHNGYVRPHADCLKTNKDSDNTLPFINYLINKEEYQSALLEIERILFSHKQDADSIILKKEYLNTK